MAEFELPTLFVEEVLLVRPAAPVALANRSPEPDGTDVPRAAALVLEVLGLERQVLAPEQVDVVVSGQPAFSGASIVPWNPAFQGRRAGLGPVHGGLRITVDPVVPFTSQQVVEVQVLVRFAGQEAWQGSYRFEVEDATAPRLLAAEALSPTRIALSFDEAVEVEDLDVVALALDRPAVPLNVVSASAVGSRVELVVASAMTPDARYQMTVRGVRDARGNALAAPDNGTTLRGYRPPRPLTRRFDLWSMLPRYNRREDATGDLRKVLSCFQEVLDLVLAEIDRFHEILDIERAPEALVDLMLQSLGNPFAFVLNELDKRRLAAVLVELYQLKGTEKGIRNAVRLFMGIELSAITTYSGASLILGESLLGIDWELSPSNRFALYAFDVHVPFVLTDEERERLRALITWTRPAHTHFLSLIEPLPPVVVEFWLLGEGEIGQTTILA